MPPSVSVDAALLRKYDVNGPPYTSYPTAQRLIEAFDARAYAHWLRNRNVGGIRRPLSLVVHLPCRKSIRYGARSKAVTWDRSKSSRYVNCLRRETSLVAGELQGDCAIAQVHWDGGTPVFLGAEALRTLSEVIRSTFQLGPRGEYSIEVDSRRVNEERVALLAGLGFNRITVGVRDFDPKVRNAPHRVRSAGETASIIDAARSNGFRSVNVDLIYGLPKQTVEGFARTLERVIDSGPDCIALYRHAPLAPAFGPQRRIAESDLPRPEVKLLLLTQAIGALTAAGYDCIGMDCFARHNSDLAVAQRQGRLTRNFQGYSSAGECDIVGLGMSAISTIGPVYAQNAKDFDDYRARLDEGTLPVLRGIELTADDLLRRAVIQSLACHFQVSKEAVSIAHLVDFDSYFAPELEQLKELERDGLARLDDDWISVTPAGRLLVRALCRVFDRYLHMDRSRAGQSRIL